MPKPFLTQIQSSVPTGTAPFSIASTTLNTNLNADLLDGQHGSYYSDAANLTGTVALARLGTGVVWDHVVYKDSALDLGWNKLADIVLGTGLYVGINLLVEVIDCGSNIGSTSNSLTHRFQIAAIRSGGVQDDQNGGSVAGSIEDYIRLEKVSLGVYELQCRHVANFRKVWFRVLQLPQYSLGTGGSITWRNGTSSFPATGTGVIYNSSATNTARDAFRNLYSYGTLGVNHIVATGNDGIRLLGRAGGTSGYVAAITPTTLSGSRTWTGPDADITLAGTNLAQTWSATQTFAAIVCEGGAAIGAQIRSTSSITAAITNTTAASAGVTTVLQLSGTTSGFTIAGLYARWVDAGTTGELVFRARSSGSWTTNEPFKISDTALTATVPLTTPDGTAAAPGLRLTSEAHGLYRAGGTSLGFAVGGLACATLNTSGLFAASRIDATVSSDAGTAVGAFTNTSTGTTAFTRFYVGQDASLQNLELRYYGSGYTTAATYNIAASAALVANSGATGGMTLVTRANADMRFYTQDSLRLTITGAGAVNFASTATVALANTTASTSTTTGALTVAGGLGVAGAAYVGAALNVAGTTTLATSLTGLLKATSGVVSAAVAGTDYAAASHTHGNITNAGAIGSTANLPIITTTAGVLTTGSFGTAASTFTEGNDARIANLSAELTRTMPTTVNDCVDIGSFVHGSGAHTLVLSITVSDTGFSVAKLYNITTKYNQSAGAWQIILPITDSGTYSSNDYRLEANSNTTTLTLRIRRTAGSTAGTARIRYWMLGVASTTFTASTTVTAGAAAITAYYDNSGLTQVGSALGWRGNTLAISGNLTVPSAATVSGTNTGDQTITLTGDVTGTGTGSFAATIANNAVTYAKMQAVSTTSRLLGSSSVATSVQEISIGAGLSLSGTTLSCTVSGGGTIGGSIASQQVAYGSGTNTISGSNDYQLATISGALTSSRSSTSTATASPTYSSELVTYTGAGSVSSATGHSVTVTATPVAASSFYYFARRAFAYGGSVSANRLASARLYGGQDTANIVTDSSVTGVALAEIAAHNAVVGAAYSSGNGVSITTAYGYKLDATFSALTSLTIGTFYGLYVPALGLTNTTITNRWGVYVADTTAKNYFGGQVQSAVTTGTAPFIIASTTVSTNLNADLLDGQEGTYYTNATNLASGTVPTARLGSGTANSTTVLRGNSTWGTAPAAGSNTHVQYNSSGSLAGSANLLHDGTTTAIGTTLASSAWLMLGASTSSRASINIGQGSTVTSPATGDIYRVGSLIYAKGNVFSDVTGGFVALSLCRGQADDLNRTYANTYGGLELQPRRAGNSSYAVGSGSNSFSYGLRLKVLPTQYSSASSSPWYDLEPSFVQKGKYILQPSTSTGGASPTAWIVTGGVGTVTQNAGGNITNPALTAGTYADEHLKQRYNTGSTSGTSSGFYVASASLINSAVTGSGGGRVTFQFSLETDLTNCQIFIGVGLAANLAGAPSALTQCIGIGSETADAAGAAFNLYSAGTAANTPVSTGVFRSTTTVYRLEIYWRQAVSSAQSDWDVNLYVLAGGDQEFSLLYEGKVSAASGPTSTTFVTPRAHIRTNNTTAKQLRVYWVEVEHSA